MSSQALSARVEKSATVEQICEQASYTLHHKGSMICLTVIPVISCGFEDEMPPLLPPKNEFIHPQIDLYLEFDRYQSKSDVVIQSYGLCALGAAQGVHKLVHMALSVHHPWSETRLKIVLSLTTGKFYSTLESCVSHNVNKSNCSYLGLQNVCIGTMFAISLPDCRTVNLVPLYIL